MNKLLPFLLLPFAAMARQYPSDSAFIRTLADKMLTDKQAYENLYQLTKKIGGRLSGSPQMYRAEQWGVAAMEAAGADKVVLQECQVPHWVRGGTDKAAAVFTDDKGKKQTIPVAVLALGNSVGTGARGIKAPLLRVRSFDELEQRQAEVKGKIVFYDVPFEETFIQTFEAYGKNVIYRAIGASRAARYGAVAVWVRSMSHSVDNHPHTGALRYLDSIPQIPAVAIGLRDVERLDSLFNSGKTPEGQMVTNGKMLGDTLAHNVIGELKGSTHPDEIITVGGHLDSWDVNEGATDDGAGVVQTIAILRAFKALGFQPAHTIRFVLFANEENGTRGAKRYAEEAKNRHEKHLFALESDAGGFTPRAFSITNNQAVLQKLNSWKPLFAPYGVEGFVPGGGGADVTPLETTFNIPVGELRPDSQRYFDVHHAVNDVLENVNIRELKLGAINMAALLYLVDKYGL